MESKINRIFCTANQIESFRSQIFNDLERFKWFDVLVLFEFFDDEKVAALNSWGFKEHAASIETLKRCIKKTVELSKHWSMFQKINCILINNVPCKFSEYKCSELQKDINYYIGLSEERITGWCASISEKLKALFVFFISQLKLNVKSKVIISQENLISFINFYSKVYADLVMFKWFDLVERLKFYSVGVMKELDAAGLKDIADEVMDIKQIVCSPLPGVDVFLSLYKKYKNPQLIFEDDVDYVVKFEEYKLMPKDEVKKWCFDLFDRVYNCTENYCEKITIDYVDDLF